MKTRALIKKLSLNFPKSIAKKHHDFVGTMVGPLPNEVKRIALCLDLDEFLLNDIERIKPDLIITHHPFFYGSKIKILKYDEHKAALYEKLLNMHVGVISMHTNFDEGKDGMNDALAGLLGLKNVYAPIKAEMMRIGYIEPMELKEFVDFAKKALNVKYALLTSNGSKIIKKVGIIGGGGSYSFRIAKEEECDIYISGDVSHHIRRDVLIEGFNYLDVPHEVERIFMSQMKKILLGIDSSLEVIELDHEEEPVVFL